jgi:hypothetical protein
MRDGFISLDIEKEKWDKIFKKDEKEKQDKENSGDEQRD